MASDFTPSTASFNLGRHSFCQFYGDKFATMASCTLRVLFALSLAPCAYAQAGFSIDLSFSRLDRLNRALTEQAKP